MRPIQLTGEFLLDPSTNILLALALMGLAIVALTRPYANRRLGFMVVPGVGAVVSSAAIWQLGYTSGLQPEDWPISPMLSMCVMLGMVVVFFTAGLLELRTHAAHAANTLLMGTGSLVLTMAFGWHATGYLNEVMYYAIGSWLAMAAMAIYAIREALRFRAQSKMMELAKLRGLLPEAEV